LPNEYPEYWRFDWEFVLVLSALKESSDKKTSLRCGTHLWMQALIAYAPLGM
jgi:hypothetical protein